jgi:hypothetical protein
MKIIINNHINKNKNKTEELQINILAEVHQESNKVIIYSIIK